jgi:hypothetical protein
VNPRQSGETANTRSGETGNTRSIENDSTINPKSSKYYNPACFQETIIMDDTVIADTVVSRDDMGSHLQGSKIFLEHFGGLVKFGEVPRKFFVI